MNVYLFNPDNDLALANYDANYHPPVSACEMGRELTPLMGWLAEDGDYLLFPEETTWIPPVLYPRLNACFLSGLTEEFIKDKKRMANINYLRERGYTLSGEKNIRPKAGEKVSGQFQEDPGKHFKKFGNAVTEALYGKHLLMPEHIIPWGWNPGLIRQLKNAGIDEALLPSQKRMDDIRRVSHRSFAVQVLRKVHEKASADLKTILCGRSSEIFSETELKKFIEQSQTPLILKAPLSGSGRGLIRADGTFEHPVSGWCHSVMQSQGSVIAEPYYNKVCDFAMEFYVGAAGDVQFRGYSLFGTNVHGSYTHNLLMTDSRIVSQIVGYGLSKSALTETSHLLEHILAEAVDGCYQGWLGVDMMVCRLGEQYCLHPCVEVNARFTMGVFSRLFYDRYVKEGITGVFRIRFSKHDNRLFEEVDRMRRQYPLVIECNKIVSGYLNLTPVNSKTHFLADILMNNTLY